MNKPIATIVSGLPLSGKTTFLATLYQNGILKSKKVSLKKLPSAVEEHICFTLEANISGFKGRKLVQAIKKAGYYIQIFVVHVDSKEIAALNLVRRVERGGKDSIMRDVVREYGGFDNFFLWSGGLEDDETVVNNADEFYYFQNSVKNKNPRLVVAYSNGTKALQDDGLIEQGHSTLPYEIVKNIQSDVQPNETVTAMKEQIDAALERSFDRIIRFYNLKELDRMARPFKTKQRNLIAYLVSTTNHGLAHYSNLIGKLEVTTMARWTGDLRDETFHTSALKGYELDGSRLTLYTLNSTYVFEIVAGEFDEFAFTRANQELIDSQDKRNNTKHDAYWCQIASGFAMIDGAINVAALPYPMTLQEARDYLLDNMLTDGEGNIVTNIMQAYIKKDSQ
jgi:predicted ABC-type ATPase